MCYNENGINDGGGNSPPHFLRKAMKSVKIKSYAKVNLTLEITGVAGGYHLLDSLVASVDLYNLVQLKKRKGSSIVTVKGADIPPEKCNALKAAALFSKTFGCDGAEIVIYENIPVGAGLGSSSADIVGVLNGMAKLYEITDRKKLKELADSLGSDTGYMLDGGFARMTGRGEKVEKLDLSNKLNLLLICPNSSVSSKACYAAYDEQPKTLEYRGCPTEDCIRALDGEQPTDAGRYFMNDLFRAAISLNEDVATAYQEAENLSPLAVNMTGSGSAVYALFESKELCEWAKSRYKGEFATYVTQTLVPNRERGK